MPPNKKSFPSSEAANPIQYLADGALPAVTSFVHVSARGSKLQKSPRASAGTQLSGMDSKENGSKSFLLDFQDAVRFEHFWRRAIDKSFDLH